MNTSKSRAGFSRLLCLSLAAGVLTAAASAATTAHASAADLSRAVGGEAPDAAFKAAFDKLVAKKDKAELAKLVKEHVNDAVEWTIYSCEQIASQSSDELETFMAEMREAWKTAERTDFAERVYTYFSTLSGVNKKDRPELKKRYDTAHDELEKNREKKDNFVFQNIVDEFEVLGGAFEQVGDMYFS